MTFLIPSFEILLFISDAVIGCSVHKAVANTLNLHKTNCSADPFGPSAPNAFHQGSPRLLDISVCLFKRASTSSRSLCPPPNLFKKPHMCGVLSAHCGLESRSWAFMSGHALLEILIKIWNSCSGLEMADAEFCEACMQQAQHLPNFWNIFVDDCPCQPFPGCSCQPFIDIRYLVQA